MRLLVACQDCKRQYDATGRRVGARFHCLCGQAVEIRPPEGHDASVVRCSSCGAPREHAASACRHCGGDFTLHEKDLHTVCPSCLARVSDKARFCHHCATPLTPEHVAGEETDFSCPVCDPERTLTSRRLGQEQISVLECEGCAGLWLGHQAVDVLTERAARGAREPMLSPKPPSGWKAPSGPRYRKCVVCRDLMPSRNYGSGSGVVIDVCRRHGAWFDSEELQAILKWIRAGGARAPVAENLPTKRTRAGDRPRVPREYEYERRRESDPLGDVLRSVIELFF